MAPIEPKTFASDDLDFRIIREILVGNHSLLTLRRQTLRDLSNRLHVHPNTVANRLRRLEQERFAFPLSIMVNAPQLGFAGATFEMSMPPSRRDPSLLPRLFKMGGVRTVFDCVDTWQVVLMAEDHADLVNQGELLREVAGAEDVRLDVDMERDWPQRPRVKISRLDAAIISALLADARASFPRVSKGLGVTARTVERRLWRLVESGLVRPYFGGHLRSSMALGWLHVQFGRTPDPVTQGKLLQQVPNSFFRMMVGTSHRFILWDEAMASLVEQAQSISRLTGVRNVLFRAVQGFHVNPNHAQWLSALVQRRASQS